MLIAIAGTAIKPQWANSTGKAMPMTTRNPVANLPKSMTADPADSMKSSGLAQRAQIQLGRGAMT